MMEEELQDVLRAFVASKKGDLTPTAFWRKTGIIRQNVEPALAGKRDVPFMWAVQTARGFGLSLADMLFELARLAEKQEISRKQAT